MTGTRVGLAPAWRNEDEIAAAFAKVGGLQAYWRSLGGGVGRVPERRLVDPAAILPLLPNIMLVEIEAAPFRVRYRLTGTLVDSATGFNLTGHYLDEYLVPPIEGEIQRLIDSYQRMFRERRPEIGVYTWTTPTRDMHVGFGLFPLLVDGTLAQAISVEEEWQPLPPGQAETWKQAIAKHEGAAGR
jgi:hypothetical protein